MSEHDSLKKQWKDLLESKGFDVKLEKRMRKNDSTEYIQVDVYAENESQIIIVEVVNTHWSGKKPQDYLTTDKEVQFIIAHTNNKTAIKEASKQMYSNLSCPDTENRMKKKDKLILKLENELNEKNCLINVLNEKMKRMELNYKYQKTKDFVKNIGYDDIFREIELHNNDFEMIVLGLFLRVNEQFIIESTDEFAVILGDTKFKDIDTIIIYATIKIIKKIIKDRFNRIYDELKRLKKKSLGIKNDSDQIYKFLANITWDNVINRINMRLGEKEKDLYEKLNVEERRTRYNGSNVDRHNKTIIDTVYICKEMIVEGIEEIQKNKNLERKLVSVQRKEGRTSLYEVAMRAREKEKKELAERGRVREVAKRLREEEYQRNENID